MKLRKLLHLVYVPMTGVGLYGGYRGDQWYADRIDIFKNYTLKSLLNQSNRNFILWMSFRPQERLNPLTAELGRHLKSVGMEYIFTFDGLMYWDDKYSKDFKSRVMNCGRVVRNCLRNKLWKDFLPSLLETWYNNKNETLVERIQRSVNKIRDNIDERDIVYMTRIDSDDMFISNMIDFLQGTPLTKAIGCVEGYIYNITTDQLAEYDPKTNPPFHTIVFPAEVFFNGELHFKYYNGYKSHEDIGNWGGDLSHILGRPFCVTTHNPKNHISTIWNHPFRGKIITENKEEILKEFGI